MPDLIELPAPHQDPRAQDAYRRERAALAADSARASHLIAGQPDADHIKEMLGIG